ncbi:MAG: ATP-binding protein, partial [Deltaproteobacteria bacterium]|nr:ATP-binding protein [Deltaproteobacteria bacterium]
SPDDRQGGLLFGENSRLRPQADEYGWTTFRENWWTTFAESSSRGAAPAWSDILSGTLYRSRHYRQVKELVDGGTSVIITGLPASGKTTLLMQLAAEIPFRGHKLYFDRLGLGKAQLVARQLAGQQALVFVDDFTDDAKAFSSLASCEGITVVGADRDFQVSITMHLIDRLRFKFVDVTEMTEADLQGCWRAIPSGIRTDFLVPPEVSRGAKPSLFEFVQANITFPRLGKRVSEAFKDICKRKPDLGEMLMVAAYVHSCRTPLSMDMALAYWSDRSGDYRWLCDLFKEAGSTLVEYGGGLVGDDQDYYAVRSKVVANVILHSGKGPFLKRILEKFHANVSRWRIARYDVFRRRAFDSG